MRDNIFERFFKKSVLNLFSSSRHPIPGSFSVHWAKEDNFLLLTFQKQICQNNENEKQAEAEVMPSSSSVKVISYVRF